jgi:hypothetical protein
MQTPPPAFDAINRWLDRMVDEKRIVESRHPDPQVRRLDVRMLANEIDDLYRKGSDGN